MVSGVERHHLPSHRGSPNFPGETVQLESWKKVEVLKEARTDININVLWIYASIFLKRVVNCIKNNVYKHKTKWIFISKLTSRNFFFHTISFVLFIHPDVINKIIRSFGKWPWDFSLSHEVIFMFKYFFPDCNITKKKKQNT